MFSMLRLFIDLLRRRAGPSDLPTSAALLVSTFVALVALQCVFAGLFGEDPAVVLPRAVVSGLATLGWLALVLRLYGRPERFLQTGTAMLGIMLVVAPIALPLLASGLSIVEVAGTAGAAPRGPLPAGPVLALLAAFALSVFLLIAQARILMAAIGRSLGLCIALCILGELMVVVAVGALGLGGPPPPAA